MDPAVVFSLPIYSRMETSSFCNIQCILLEPKIVDEVQTPLSEVAFTLSFLYLIGWFFFIASGV
jgi:hypothetical protein